MKRNLKTLLFFVTVAGFFIYATSIKRSKPSNAGPIFGIFPASIKDMLPLESVTNEIKEVNGHKIRYRYPNKYVYYFEYEADYEKILTVVGSLKFKINDKDSDMYCRLILDKSRVIPRSSSLHWREYNVGYFFWDIQPEKFTFYECIKSPDKHTLLISNSSKRILHRIESY